MIGCLCLHGFTGEPWEVEPVSTYFLENKRWLVYTPTLPGHGPKGDLRDVTYQQWVFTAEVAVCELLSRCEKVYVIGFSMGGMLACYIAAKYEVSKLVLLSAAAYYGNPQQLLQELKDKVRLRVLGELDQDEHYLLYRKKIMDTPMTAVFQFMQVVKKIKPYINKVSIPTLILQGEQDGIVPRKSALYLYETISSEQKKLNFLPESKHLICHGFEKELLINKIEAFLCREEDEDESGCT
ncbi:alpha/beta hydrolase [Halalkalibacter alkaliphilus]|jgi:esterase/lipase|uniref:Alpha/beta fold hydrolase n=1 Tax=Halalkalibacter alkaliphilus TaxID=2917993 RepID=A0A9X2CVF5_9BACI|nr:alpha/beta fold hydrolase [Halalkalibacter alkaliphilus]MCL7749022.1 alpha/beta fold hydrolase [Halalkalibacter alkaliphilus]